MTSKIRRILYITDQTTAVYIVQGRRLLGKRTYALDQQGFDAFSADLAQLPGLLTQVLLDITEEEFYTEQVPHVFSHDQRMILARKQNQRFRGRRWIFNEKQGREKTGRRDDLFLLSAVTREELVDPWLRCMAEQYIPLERITSVPLLSSHLYRRLHLRHAHALFVSHGDGGGIRQSFLVGGKLKTSRLAPTPKMEEGEYVGLILAEVKRMQQFLVSAFLLPQGEPLHLYLLGSNQVQVLMSRALASDSGIHLHSYNPQAVEEKFHYRGLRRCHHADGFFAMLAANAKAVSSYTTFEDRLFYHHQRVRQLLRGAAAAMLLGSMATVGFGLVRQTEIRDNLADVEQAIGRYQQLHARLQANTQPGQVSGFKMKDAVEAHERLQRMRVRPFQLLSHVGQALLKHPDIRLRRIDWQLIRQVKDPEQAGEQIEQARLAGSVLEESEGNEKGPWVPALRLQGEVERRSVSWRVLHRSFQGLVSQLDDSDAVNRVHVERWPLEVRPDKALVLDETQQKKTLGSPFALILMGRELL